MLQLIMNSMPSQGMKLETRNCKRRSRRVASALCLVAALALSSAATRAQQSGSWSFDGDGNWSDTTKWSGGLVATGATFAATFNFDITADRTVTLDENITIGSVIFGDTGGNSLWTLRTLNSSVLTMDDGASKPVIRAIQPTPGFSCNVVIAGTNGFRGPNAAAGVLTVGAANTYTGDTEVTRGILRINNVNALPSKTLNGRSGNVVCRHDGNPGDQGTLDLNANSITINGLASDATSGGLGTVTTVTAGAVTLTVGDNNATAQFDGVIQNGAGTMSLVKIGTGTETLTGDNSYSGVTTISGGTLAFAVFGDAPNSTITVGASGTLLIQQFSQDSTWTGKSVTFNGGALTIDLGSNPISTFAAPVAFSQGVTVGATPTISITGPTIPNGTYPLIAYTTSLTGAGLLPSSVSLPGGGFGTLHDNTSIQTIELVVGGPPPPTIHWATGNGTWNTTTFNWKGAIGSTNYFPGVPVQFTDLDSTGNPAVTLGISVQPASVLVNATKDYTLTGTGSIDGSASLTKVGIGALTLDLASGFTGGAAVSQGTVNIKKAAAFGGVAGTLTMLGGTLDNTSAGALTLLDYPQAWNGDFAFAGSHNLDMGAGSVSMNAARTVTVNAGTLRVAGDFSFGNLYPFTKAGAGTLQMDGTIGTMIGNVTVNGGTLELSGTNTFAGDVRIVAGNLVMSNSLALGKSALNLASTDSGTWSFAGLTSVTLGSLKGSRPLGLINANGAALELQVGNWNAFGLGIYNGTISGPGRLTKVGSGTWQFGGGGAGSGTYTGDTTVNNGKLQVGAANVFPHGAGKGNLVVNSPGIFDELDRSSETVNALNGDGIVEVSDRGGLALGTAQVLNVGDGNASGAFSGGMNDANSDPTKKGKLTLVKIGKGTQTLSGTCAYSGTTTVNGGTLLVNSPGSLPATAVTVNSSGTLGGSGGIINGPVTVNAGGSISAGANAGPLTLMAALDLSAGGANVWELAALKDDSDGAPGTDFGQIIMTAAMPTLGGSSSLKLLFTGAGTAPDGSNPFWQTSHRWTVISAPGAVSDFAAIQNGAFGAGTFATSVEAGGIVLTFTPGLNMSIATGPGSNLTLSYRGGTGSQFVLLQTNNVAAPLNLWKRVKTNTLSSGTFTITPGSDPKEFYRVKSE